MDLYFSPLACSMAVRIALYEAGASVNFVRVDAKTKRTEHGEDFLAIHPLGFVPALRTPEGDILTENAAILTYVADSYAPTQLAPGAGLERARLHQWLSFTGTELHKAVFAPLLDANAPEEAKRYALDKAAPRLTVLERHLERRDYLLESFSVADAYLFTVLGWTTATPMRLHAWAALSAYVTRLRERPSVARALTEERPLFAKPA